MASLAPPPSPPTVTTGEGDGMNRFRVRMTQISASAVTVVATAWCCTLGVLPAIISIMIAKHILVAILLWGLGVDSTQVAKSR
jgi:hypothetical protein